MRNAIRLVLLLAFALAASWAPTPKPAQALPVCEGFDALPCNSPGRRIFCVWLDGSGGGLCVCNSETLHWECL